MIIKNLLVKNVALYRTKWNYDKLTDCQPGIPKTSLKTDKWEMSLTPFIAYLVYSCLECLGCIQMILFTKTKDDSCFKAF